MPQASRRSCDNAPRVPEAAIACRRVGQTAVEPGTYPIEVRLGDVSATYSIEAR
jgi:hypothetical protein